MGFYPTNERERLDQLELGDRVAREFLQQSSYDKVLVMRELVAR